LKRAIGVSVAIVLLLAGMVVFNHARTPSRQLSVAAIPVLELDEQPIIDRFGGSLRERSVSQSMAKVTADSPLIRFGDFLEEAFPFLLDEPFKIHRGGEFGDDLNPSLLIEWPGTDAESDAVLLMSHFDVVPAAVPREDDSQGGDGGVWEHPPFSGHVDQTYIWGRGAIDCKHGVMGILEAIGLHFAGGFKPRRTIYIALGHDEELGGGDGNRKMAEWLGKRGRRLHCILDEGGCIFTEFPGLSRPAALIGVAEKGVLVVELSVVLAADRVGHASMPPGETSIGILAAALHRIERSPFPARIDAGLRDTLAYLGPEMDALANRVAASNLWLFSPLVRGKLSRTPTGNALLRTTIAPTLVSTPGTADNVLPISATATLNLRLLPGDGVDYAIGHLREVIDDPRVEVVAKSHSRDASPVSDTLAEPFGVLQRTVGEVFPDVVVAPFVLVGGTDTVHYVDLCQNIYRFIPARLSERDTKRFHGVDERISRQDYLNIVRFFHRFVENMAGDVSAAAR
jgi:carboxypeptidase PM20D1